MIMWHSSQHLSLSFYEKFLLTVTSIKDRKTNIVFVQGERGRIGDIGLKGFPGIPGIPGLVGIKGERGLVGIKGQEGEKGDQGVNPVSPDAFIRQCSQFELLFSFVLNRTVVVFFKK